MDAELLGFTGSPKEIYEAMPSQTELIPFDDKLSSDVAFIEEGAKVLNYQWIFAPFSDDNLDGYLLVKYTLTDVTPGDWEVIDAYLAEQ